MLRFLATRVSLIIPTSCGTTRVTFPLVRLIPGDPIEALAGERGLDPVRHEQLRHEYGFDRPVLVQYGIYIARVLHGDLGISSVTHAPVVKEFGPLFPATVQLASCAMIFAILLGLPSGIVSAVKRNSIFDHGGKGISLTGYSMPIFWW